MKTHTLDLLALADVAIDDTCLPTLEYVCDNAGGTWQGIGSNCENAGCPPAEPTGACCVSSGCVANSNDDCTALGGTWLGDDGSCDDCAPTCQGDANADGVGRCLRPAEHAQRLGHLPIIW